MPCRTPLGVRNLTAAGVIDHNGKLPFWITVPCGKCPDCRRNRINGWAFRLEQEEKRCISAHFITMTYDNEFLPITRTTGQMTVYKKHTQDFFKRLRKTQPEIHIKYFLCAEYGGQTERPHYHAIVFNVINPGQIIDAWRVKDQPMGNVFFGSVTPASIVYTLKYMDKPRLIPSTQSDKRNMEFQIMSKGLGSNYLTPKMVRWHMNDKYHRMYLNVDGNKKISMPRYYKEKLYNKYERKSIGASSHADMEARTEQQKISYKGDYIRDQIESDIQRFKKFNQNQKKCKL